jgi:splicing factor 3B subunit 3
VTSLCVIDYNSVAGTDKFGNVFVLRVPDGTIDDVENPTGSRMLWEHGLLNGAPTKASLIAHYYLGQVGTTITKCALVPGGKECMVVSTITGAIFAFVPFSSKQDVTFFQHLEMYLRQECPNISQRDHLSYRSSFQPVKDTIDGDLCERFGSMPYAKQQEFGEDVDRTPSEILKKLEETRNIL